MALQAKLAAVEINDQQMADAGRRADGAMDVVTGGALDGLLRTLQHAREHRPVIDSRRGLQIGIDQFRRGVADTDWMHVGQIGTATDGFDCKARSIGADAAVPVEARFAVALVDGDGAIMTAQTGNRRSERQGAET